MALSASGLTSAIQSSVYNKIKELQEPKIPEDADAGQRADVDQGWSDLATAVAEAAADVISEFLANAEITVTVPPSTFLVGATAPVFNPAPVSLTGTISA